MKRLFNISLGMMFVAGLLSCNAQNKKHAAESPFEFRGIYSPVNAREDIRKEYKTHHVDYDWGLWGHNLHKVLGENPDEEILATVDGKKDKEQYCFSSDKMYEKTVEYIIDNFGYGDKPGTSTRICIMPRDNKKACTCDKCVAAGNTSTNATPAVTNMMRRLAKRFPGHQFFTSAYHTTKAAPAEILPDNVGVIISAIDLPMRVRFTENKGYRTFKAMVDEWKEKASLIYVWDYSKNYEDYLSPFPCLMVMQKRFQLYKEMGVKGIFLNGSGDDYAAFDDLHTVVLAKLMNDVDIDVAEEIKKFFKENYPQTGTMLCDYYMKLEQHIAKTNHILPLYGTTDEMVESYLDPIEFEQFRNKLDRASKDVDREEREKLNYLLTSLSFTQLQLLNRINVHKDNDFKVEMIEVLKGHKELKGMDNYGETNADIEEYIKKLK